MKSLKIKIARTCGGIAADDGALNKILESYFRSYLSDEEPLFNIYIKGSYRNLNKPCGNGWPVFVRETKEVYEIIEKREKKTRLLGIIDSRKNLCHIDIRKYFNYSNLIQALRACFHFFIEERGGFFLHAGCGVVSGKAYIFAGRHGAGKSTALRNLQPESVIAEDTVVIKNNGCDSLVFSTPFRREENASGRVEALIFPRKFRGSPYKIKEPKAASASELISNALFSSPYSWRLVDSVVKNISLLCESTPGYRLYFPREGSIREVVTGT